MLANRLREIREQKEMTQEALAGQVGVTRQTIIAVEKGKFGPSVSLALQLARVLGTTVDNLFWLHDGHPSPH
jgi:putative transcriptional regulator